MHQRVETGPLCTELVEQGVDVLGSGEVRGNDVTRVPLPAQCLGGFLQRLRPAAHENDLGAERRQFHRDGTSDTAARSGDQCRSCIEPATGATGPRQGTGQRNGDPA